MRIGEVIGKVTLSIPNKQLSGGRLLIVQPDDTHSLHTGQPSKSEPVVVYDELGAGLGQKVGFSEGREAAMPFHPDPVAIDCYLACLLDEITCEEEPIPVGVGPASCRSNDRLEACPTPPTETGSK